MKILLKFVWDLLSLGAVVGTYYGAWQHNWVLILVFAIPQFISLGYTISKASNGENKP